MSETSAVRTLLKSVPELWTACSDAEALAGHLGAFGEIRISRLEPETTVAWESDRASGTVTLEAAGWGTKVTMTAITVQERRSGEMARAGEESAPVEEARAVQETPPADEPPASDEALPFEEAPPPPTGLLERLLARWRTRHVEPVSGPHGDLDPAIDETPVAPVSAEPPTPEPPTPEPPTPEPPTAEQAQLEAALDSLGQAHHRPFSNRDLSRI